MLTTVVVEYLLFTTSVRAVEVLAAKLPSPAKAAVIELDPVFRDEVVRLAMPLDKGAAPKTVVPALKVTRSPSGGTPKLELTVAVRMTGCPIRIGFADELIPVVVGAFASTTWLIAAEVLGALTGSPLYTAVMLRVPVSSVELLKAAVPPITETVPKPVVPALNVTDPVRGLVDVGVTIAVNVTV